MVERIRMLLVDDEEYVITALKRHVHWDDFNIDIIGEAYDGQEGLEKAITLKPDCILTDISMPRLDGISMIEQLYRMSSHPYFLIYTGYDDFDYAKKALSYGVCDYILKPSLPEDFTAPLEMICSKINEERKKIRELTQLKNDFEKSKQQLFFPFLNDLLAGRILTYEDFSQKDQFFSSGLTGKLYRVIGIHLDNTQDVFSPFEIEQQLYTIYRINQFIFSSLPGKVYSPGFKSNTAYFLCATQDRASETDQLTQNCTRILDFCNKIDNLNLSVRIGISDNVSAFDEIHSAYQQARSCIRESSGNQVIQFDRIESDAKESSFSWGFDKDQFIDAILIGNVSLAKQLLDTFFNRIFKLPPPQDVYLTPLLAELIGSTTVSLLQHGIEYDYSQFSFVIQKHSTIQEAQIHVSEYFQDLMETIQKKELAKNYQVIHKMIAFTRDHYMEGITLSEIADRLKLTPNYLSSLFAKSMGVSFSHYLAKMRIQKAKELIDSGKYKVYEVGDMVGYKNPEYFTKVFKEFVGATPSAYGKLELT